MSPKQFARIVRFNTAVKHLKSIAKNTILTDIAIQFGYFDRAHFINDFKALCGESPLAYYKRLAGLPTLAK